MLFRSCQVDLNLLTKLGQNLGINAICFLQKAMTIGKLPYLSGISHANLEIQFVHDVHQKAECVNDFETTYF